MQLLQSMLQKTYLLCALLLLLDLFADSTPCLLDAINDAWQAGGCACVCVEDDTA